MAVVQIDGVPVLTGLYRGVEPAAYPAPQERAGVADRQEGEVGELVILVAEPGSLDAAEGAGVEDEGDLVAPGAVGPDAAEVAGRRAAWSVCMRP
ncbi:hypothetical protein PL81_02950 [Streptomyces sp. RSD-27]|nr:hypothetical protein PL81_02950 [Streptomyces sp. RSD-27]